MGASEESDEIARGECLHFLGALVVKLLVFGYGFLICVLV